LIVFLAKKVINLTENLKIISSLFSDFLFDEFAKTKYVFYFGKRLDIFFIFYYKISKIFLNGEEKSKKVPLKFSFGKRKRR